MSILDPKMYKGYRSTVTLCVYLLFRLLSMHSSLMKRYEKEVKQNMTHIETITNLNVRTI